MMSPVMLVLSDISHTRYGKPSHYLKRKGLSLWIDLDDLAEANHASWLFSVNRFNLLSFREKDYGPNFHARRYVMPLAQYIRELAAEVIPETKIAHVRLLTFPRILGAVFNPLSVYVASDASDQIVMTVYEVSNTFGEKHTYVAHDHAPEDAAETTGARPVHVTEKRFYVSPFFPVEGEYQLSFRHAKTRMQVMVAYSINNKPALLAVLRGVLTPLTGLSILKHVISLRQLPMRPFVSIHVEALKLWWKRVRYFSRPVPPEQPWSKTVLKKNRPR
ncbi:MAG: hypothetical protein CBC12_11945 [Candidatus Puniceispirillum sp. TMED52]|nr:DUF1365 domain-containing protein [SAR116 cluster bacterium]OUU46235.1 MAG: hypothetical protein CBC12_11945 [Candidatus Puniceispirillum sp. TMED52]